MDIELAIKIDEDTYKDIKKGKVYSSVRDVPQESVAAIANGKLLPKGHEDLIDAVPIVKCKDCKHRAAENGLCEGRGWPMQLVPDDGFCDKGERE